MAAAVHEMGWGEYLTQDFYHLSILPLLAATIGLAYAARPTAGDELPAGFRKFQMKYLTVWALCVAADWLQGPYVYALYAAYGFTSAEIAQLFVAGFGSSMVFGCIVGTVTDKFGRKKCCIMYCLLYIASCMTKHFKQYQILMFGRITGGLATSMLFSCFECWMVSEHTQRHNFSGGLLGYMFGMMFTVMYSVAILSGLAGQVVADAFTFGPMLGEGGIFYTGGYCCPFDLAILCLIVGLLLIIPGFEENYGNAEGDASSSLMDNLKDAVRILGKDKRALLLGVVVSSFEGSMFAFVFNWTPALNSTTIPPPHGVIFALFMMSCMCGASMSTLLGSSMKPATRLNVTFASGFACFVMASHAVASGAEDNLRLSLTAFLMFEFCVGVYFPSVGVLKSEIVPEAVRGTVYNIYRIPLNAIVVGLLLSNISMATCFKLNAVLLLISLGCMVAISTAPSTSSSSSSGDIEMPPKTGIGYDPVETDVLTEDSATTATVVGRRRNGGE
mmetsp:Transcript_147993/g.475187  ORF Transcript_147993/g.475187 Transcript_147993/m.475187 type:complete len:502 (-) Transcript_147993:217-1722(-)